MSWISNNKGNIFFNIQVSRKYLTIVCHKSTGWAIIKRGTLLLSISSPINDQFSKFFHWHTLWKICNNVIIIFIPPHRKCVYTTLRNMNEICMYNDNSKHLSKIEKKTLQTNIAVNDLYNTRSCGSNTVICHMHDSPQCWSEVFFIYLNVCYYH